MMSGRRKMRRRCKTLLGILVILTGVPQFGQSYNDATYKPVQSVMGNASVAGDGVEISDLQDKRHDVNRASLQMVAVFRELRIGLTGKCLDFAGATAVNGSKVILWDCIDVALQKWLYEETSGFIRNKANPDFCLDNMNQRYDGGDVQLWKCDAANTNQQWVISASVLSPRSLKSLALTTYGTSNGSRVGLSTYLGDEYQQWTWGYAQNIPTHDDVITQDESVYSLSTKNKCTNVYSSSCAHNIYNRSVQGELAQNTQLQQD